MLQRCEKCHYGYLEGQPCRGCNYVPDIQGNADGSIIKKCEICGMELLTKRRNTKYCEDCRLVIKYNYK